MAFIIENNTVVSFAEYADVVSRDQRLFDNNEGLTDDVIEPLLERATQRIVTRISNTDWYRTNWINQSGQTPENEAQIPALNPNWIKSRNNDFVDLCVYTALAEYILPSIADFGTKENAEVNKIGFYGPKAEQLFGELITAGDWYDWSGDGTVTPREKNPGVINLKRVR